MRPDEEWLARPDGLRDQLRAMREAAGLTGDQLAANLGWARSKVPKLENGPQKPSDEDVTAWVEACGRPDAAEELLSLLAESRTIRRQWRHQRRRGHAAIQEEYDRIVREATRIRDVETFAIPGLLQTHDYALCKIEEAVANHGFPANEVDKTLRARLKRRDVLFEGGRTFEFIITEAALRFLPCEPEVMLAQLRRLADDTTLPGVTLAIVPMGRRLPVTPINEFLITDDATHLETHLGDVTLTGEESAVYARRADGLLAEAVTGDEARALIAAAAEALH